MCSVCRGKIALFQEELESEILKASPSLLEEFEEKYQAKFSKKASTRERAKFLCGLTSPYSLQIKGKTLKNFGIFEGINFTKILKKVEGYDGEK